MTVQDALERVVEALGVLKVREHGRLEALAATIGEKRGYITRWPESGGYPFSRLLTVLGLYGETPERFFAQAFDISPDPDIYLADLLRPGQEKSVLGLIERVTRRIERDPPPDYDPSPYTASLGDLIHASRSDQRKRLRGTRKYQTVAFLRRYLDHLDDLRYESPEDSAYLAETLVREVIALVVASKAERLELQCRALGVYASAHRVIGNFANAARAFVLGLDVARRNDLEVTVAELLQRGAYLLSDHGEYNRALTLLGEAQNVYSDLEMEESRGKILVSRGVMMGLMGRQEKGLRLFNQALAILPSDDSTTRWRVAALHGMAILHRQLDDLEGAENLLAQAIDLGAKESSGIVAKLDWELGVIAAEKEDYGSAEELLLKALRKLSYRDSPLQVCFASLCLISVLLKTGRRRQACSLARELAPVLSHLKGNKIARGAMMALVDAGFAGEVDQALLDQVSESINEGCAPGRRHTSVFTSPRAR